MINNYFTDTLFCRQRKAENFKGSCVSSIDIFHTRLNKAFDLKCANVVFGLSAQAGKRASLWCEGFRNEEFGKIRNLDYFY